MNTLPDLAACRLCPRRCGVNRNAVKLGYCGAGVAPRVFRHGPHFGEEPPLSGEKGSGAVFFSHCTLRCVYCQNYPWSQLHQGDDLSLPGLTAIFGELAAQGCHNWNLVSPTPWLPQIRAALTPLIQAGIRLPIIYNTSGFEAPETLALYTDLTDIALIDLRYALESTAREASDGAGYIAAARNSMLWFWKHLGPLQTDARGVAQRGTICRLLVLPGHADETVENLTWLASRIGTQIHVSVMSQYTPVYHAGASTAWNRKPTKEEYRLVTEAVETLGFENGWVQEYDAESPADLLGCAMSAGAGITGRVDKCADR